MIPRPPQPPPAAALPRPTVAGPPQVHSPSALPNVPVVAPVTVPAVPSPAELPLTSARSTASPVAQADLGLVRKLVRERSGIVIEPSQEYLVATRLHQVARRRGMEHLAPLFDQLRRGNDAHLASEVVEALTTNETSFFRDTEPFEALKGNVIPELMRARAARRQLRIWSAASSSGQEAYSLLMTLRDSFPQLSVWKVELLGTDLSAEMVKRARAAVYSGFEVRRGMPEAQSKRWLEAAGDDFRVKEELRKSAEFREMNLVAPWPPFAAFDLVLLRNVLIYFDLETKRQILKKARAALAPDGFLMVGASESLLGIDDSFKSVRVGRATVYRP
jgi:chemotaxis protein methyltransferase CheR